MIRFFRPALIAAAFSGVLAAPVIASDEPGQDSADQQELTKGEKELAKLLDGRVAGEPLNCIRNYPNQSLRVIDDTAYVYGRGKTIYVQRTKNPEDIDDDDILVLKTFTGSQLCRLDNVTTVDRSSGFFSGAVFFDDFIPYTRADDAGAGEG